MSHQNESATIFTDYSLELTDFQLFALNDQ